MDKRVAFLSLCAGVIVVIAVMLVWTPGIAAQNLTPAQEQPHQGDTCTVYLQHPMVAGFTKSVADIAKSSVMGQFVAMDAEWIIVKVGDNNQQLWVNRDSVVAMTVGSGS